MDVCLIYLSAFAVVLLGAVALGLRSVDARSRKRDEAAVDTIQSMRASVETAINGLRGDLVVTRLLLPADRSTVFPPTAPEAAGAKPASKAPESPRAMSTPKPGGAGTLAPVTVDEDDARRTVELPKPAAAGDRESEEERTQVMGKGERPTVLGIGERPAKASDETTGSEPVTPTKPSGEPSGRQPKK
jgi:hypothetical protein